MNFFGGDKNENQGQNYSQPKSSGGGFMDKINGAMGGGEQGEKKEDMLDKAVDFAQEKLFGAGPQNNESAFEQAKDEQISDAIRRKYKAATGRDFPIADKD
ncbi:hypothetical protein BDQ12DRAFT_775027 [Crucibulum laeve]|uniref:DNA damage-responsive protein 48 n=1 Tax=Crucibulum laeve TaxID=68775 RepID=A0A5C3LIW3_9AGAR|nr:hypothetical protein BDQ12DRAFT_775027 [Crucibulum laeve]